MKAEHILKFWFQTLTAKDWFAQNHEVDNTIMHRFGPVHERAVAGGLTVWRETIHGRLAEIIVLDQFSRNLHRNTSAAFAADGMALALSQEAIDLDLKPLNRIERSFLYMPFMHSESLLMHRRSIELFSEPGLEHNLTFAQSHMAIIERFGRYPHRNGVLNRQSTQQELAYLQDGGETFS